MKLTSRQLFSILLELPLIAFQRTLRYTFYNWTVELVQRSLEGGPSWSCRQSAAVCTEWDREARWWETSRDLSNASAVPAPAATTAPFNHPDDELVSCTARHLSYYIMQATGASQVVLVGRKLPASAGDVRDEGSIPGSGRSLEEEMATHSSMLAWDIPWTEEPGGLQSIGSQS